MAKQPDYRVAILHRLGFPVTKANLRFLSSWQAQEGGATHNDATFNWFNTTRGSQFPSINSVGVRAYPNFQTGISQTVDTLRNGRYDDILAALSSGEPFAAGPRSGLSTWVSGSPTGNLSYAARVLGSSAAPGVPSKARALAKDVSKGKTSGAGKAPLGGGLDFSRQALLSYFIDSNNALMSGDAPPSFAPYAQFAQLAAGSAAPTAQRSTNKAPQKATGRVLSSTKASGGYLEAPTSWTGTHVTDGLGWGTKTAEDIMADPGTQVGAPEDGTVVYWHPTGAQGGGSMMFQTDSGHQYWLGHIANGVPAGTKVRKGDVIARISADHPRPHLHIDERDL